MASTAIDARGKHISPAKCTKNVECIDEIIRSFISWLTWAISFGMHVSINPLATYFRFIFCASSSFSSFTLAKDMAFQFHLHIFANRPCATSSVYNNNLQHIFDTIIIYQCSSEQQQEKFFVVVTHSTLYGDSEIHWTSELIKACDISHILDIVGIVRRLIHISIILRFSRFTWTVWIALQYLLRINIIDGDDNDIVEDKRGEYSMRPAKHEQIS